MEIKDLEAKIDELINLCDELEKHNLELRSDQQNWAQERARLVEKNELARTKVEAMIVKLKNLEKD